jgi:hypothetical protein
VPDGERLPCHAARRCWRVQWCTMQQLTEIEGGGTSHQFCFCSRRHGGKMAEISTPQMGGERFNEKGKAMDVRTANIIAAKGKWPERARRGYFAKSRTACAGPSAARGRIHACTNDNDV